MTIQATAPAKLVLLGEYAVLEGAPAIVAAVDRTVRVTLRPAEDDRWHFTSDLVDHPASDVAWRADGLHIDVEAGPNDEWTVLPGTVIECVCDAADVEPHKLPPLSIHIESRELYVEDGTTKLGLGSSAGLIVALGTALRQHLAALGHLPAAPAPEDALLEDLAVNAEVQHGRGSGIDIAAATFGGLLAYQVAEDAVAVETLTLPANVVFATVWTGTSASTRTFLDGMEAYEQQDGATYARHIAALRALTERGREACLADDAEAWMDVIRAWTPAMAALGEDAGLPIVAGAHARLAALAATTQAAYKPSGAGGGDVGLLFAPSKEALQQTTALARQNGYGLLSLGVCTDGVHVRQLKDSAS